MNITVNKGALPEHPPYWEKSKAQLLPNEALSVGKKSMSILSAAISLPPGTIGGFDNEHGAFSHYERFNLHNVTDTWGCPLIGTFNVFCATNFDFSRAIPYPVTFTDGNAVNIPCQIGMSGSMNVRFNVKVQGSNKLFYGIAYKTYEFNKPQEFTGYGFTIPATGTVNYSDVHDYHTYLTRGAADVNHSDLYRIVYQIIGNNMGIAVTGHISGVSGADLDGYRFPVNLDMFKHEGTVELRAYLVNETTSGYAISVALGPDPQVITIEE